MSHSREIGDKKQRALWCYNARSVTNHIADFLLLILYSNILHIDLWNRGTIYYGIHNYLLNKYCTFDDQLVKQIQYMLINQSQDLPDHGIQ